jgi:hypothetical protein
MRLGIRIALLRDEFADGLQADAAIASCDPLALLVVDEERLGSGWPETGLLFPYAWPIAR